MFTLHKSNIQDVQSSLDNVLISQLSPLEITVYDPDGSELFKINPEARVCGQVFFDENFIAFNNINGVFTCLDRYSGKAINKIKTNGISTSSIIHLNDKLYFLLSIPIQVHKLKLSKHSLVYYDLQKSIFVKNPVFTSNSQPDFIKARDKLFINTGSALKIENLSIVERKSLGYLSILKNQNIAVATESEIIIVDTDSFQHRTLKVNIKKMDADDKIIFTDNNDTVNIINENIFTTPYKANEFTVLNEDIFYINGVSIYKNDEKLLTGAIYKESKLLKRGNDIFIISKKVVEKLT